MAAYVVMTWLIARRHRSWLRARSHRSWRRGRTISRHQPVSPNSLAPVTTKKISLGQPAGAIAPPSAPSRLRCAPVAKPSAPPSPSRAPVSRSPVGGRLPKRSSTGASVPQSNRCPRPQAGGGRLPKVASPRC
jgi:hypothetical protein